MIGGSAYVPVAYAQRAGDPIELAPHRAVYDLKLGQSKGKRQLAAVRGRILYDFQGNRCEGYALQFRQVTEMDSGEGKNITSDLRSTNWEEGAGKSFRFTVQNFLGGNEADGVDGRVEQGASGVTGQLKKPEVKQLELGKVIFPSEHMRQVIAAAREGKSLLEVAVYDGSDNGEKVYNTLTVIGQPIAADREPTDAAAGQKALANMKRWPVTVSYFDRGAAKDGEQTPAYSISFEAYENGISRALKLDYGDFTLTGEMTTLEIRDAKPCQ
jgi:hypothetical protein